jgi:hypothetical protein
MSVTSVTSVTRLRGLALAVPALASAAVVAPVVVVLVVLGCGMTRLRCDPACSDRWSLEDMLACCDRRSRRMLGCGGGPAFYLSVAPSAEHTPRRLGPPA